MATIEKRQQTPGTVRYRVRWWANERQRSKTFDRYEDARRFKAMLEGDLANGSYIDPRAGQLTVGLFARDWLSTVIDIRPTTKERLDTAVRVHVLPEFGNLPLAGVTHEHITRWVSDSLKHLSAASVRKNVFALRRMLTEAEHRGLIRSNPATSVRLPAEPKHEQRFLTKEEAIRLSESVPARYRAMVLLAVFGGLRFGEICALRREHVDAATCRVRVRQTLIDVNGSVTFGPPKTKTSVRDVTVPRSVMAELVSHMATYGVTTPDHLVFTFANGKPIRRAWFRNTTWLPATSKAGLSGVRFHDLRHTFVSLWVQLGRNAKEVSKVAGHSSVAFTLDRYGHLYETDDDGLADRLDALL